MHLCPQEIALIGTLFTMASFRWDVTKVTAMTWLRERGWLK